MTFVELSYLTFAICAAILIWTYGLYPLVLRLLSPFYKPIKKGKFETTISIIVPTYNEEGVIDKKLRNTQWLEYSGGNKEIIVVDSNSTDETVERAMKFQGVKIIREKRRLGKSYALNKALKIASGQIILITDADCILLKKDSLLKLSANFADKSVGAVAAPVIFSEHRKSIIRKKSLGKGIESWNNQSLLDSISTGFGDFLAFRKKLIEEIDVRCLADDLYISMQVRSKGYRVVCEPEISVLEPTPNSTRVWYKQTVRRKLNSYTTLWHKKSMIFNPRYGWYGMMILPTSLLFHNLSPFLLIGCLGACFLINPLLMVTIIAVTPVVSIFSQIIRKMLFIQLVDLNAWLLYFLRKHRTAWSKEPRTGVYFFGQPRDTTSGAKMSKA